MQIEVGRADMPEGTTVSLTSVVKSFSQAFDLISPVLVKHHEQVGYIAARMANHLDYSPEQQLNLFLAGALHDCGALSLKQKMDALKFETETAQQHSETGYHLLKEFSHFSEAARYIRHHHVHWKEGRGEKYEGKDVAPQSHLLHLADRVAVLIESEKMVLGQTDSICKKIRSRSGSQFGPQFVKAFIQLAKFESFWLDIVSSSPLELGCAAIPVTKIELDLQKLNQLSEVFSHLIDFRSSFTATHSTGVAEAAAVLAQLAGFSQLEAQMMRIAGNLHDLGKLTVPAEILNKPEKLTQQQIDVIRTHTYYTYRVLEPVSSMKTINRWASYHHERIDGQGYPFHISGEELSLGARIMAVSDVFTALSEDRPYREGMDRESTMNIITNMANSGALASQIVSLLKRNYNQVYNRVCTSQSDAARKYRQKISS